MRLTWLQLPNRPAGLVESKVWSKTTFVCSFILYTVLQFSISTLFHCLDGPYLLFPARKSATKAFPFFCFSFLVSVPQHPSPPYFSIVLPTTRPFYQPFSFFKLLPFAVQGSDGHLNVCDLEKEEAVIDHCPCKKPGYKPTRQDPPNNIHKQTKNTQITKWRSETSDPFTNLTSLLFSGSSVFSFFFSSLLHAGRHGWNTDCAAVLNFLMPLWFWNGTTNWLRLVLAFRWILVD